jgi:methylenetetrahydrofolate--tRNA-(uracil-5-)-methyltransferase
LSIPVVHIIGGGLAGCEAAWQAASVGVRVVLHEMRPVRATAVHKTDQLAELVCSNSLRGDKLDNAVGLLKEEMRRLGSLVMRAADAHRVPAGAALAVDRDRFSQAITEAIQSHPLISVTREEVGRIPADPGMFPLIVATGPLTSDTLSADIAALVGADHLYFYDAISPIILAETIDMTRVFRASRWGRSLRTGSDSRGDPTHNETPLRESDRSLRSGSDSGDDPTHNETPPRESNRHPSLTPSCGVDDGEGDYLNCPMTKEEYDRFYEAVVSAESATVHDFDKEKFFEGCLPIEVMAHRGRDTLRYGPMKPVGLVDPRTGRQPFAAVQLRQDNLAGDHFSLVGFQTQLKWGEQARVLKLVPGLENAEFVRFGMVHRNTYVNGPTVLRETWQTKFRDDLFFAGQISGVEGYVESAASGLIAGRNAAALVRGEEPRVPPRTTAIGALAFYVSHADPRNYQPTNITFGIMTPAPERTGGRLGRAERKLAVSERALADLETWTSGADPSGPRGEPERLAPLAPS